jgi:Phage-related lysozyme (muraminidase)
MAKKVLIIFAVVVIIFIITNLVKVSDVVKKAGQFIAGEERFTPKPYWDYKQWSWGYGTKVPDSTASPTVIPNVTIGIDTAKSIMNNHISKDYAVLKPLARKELTPNQWAALLSFSYNLGIGTGKTMLSRINSNIPNLEAVWKSYIYAGGAVSNGLISRRNKEWNLYNS